jgi:hypothetical protein
MGTHALQGNCRTFPETGQQVCGLFLRYWDSHGGLAQQGLPITGELREVSQTDGRTYFVQYFERAIFEWHPEKSGTPYEVLLSLLGRFTFNARYPPSVTPRPDEQPNRSPGSLLFRETGKHLGGRFLQYWRENGGLAQQGYPITDEFIERSALDGKTYRVQYFERAVFELHPENAPPNDVLLSQLGTYRHRALYGGREDNTLKALGARPLTLPTLSTGESCRPSSGRRVSQQFGEAFGIGPVFPVLGSQGTAQIDLSSATVEGGWYLVKTLWVAPSAHTAPTLVRGGRIDGAGEMRFGPGANPQPALELTASASGNNEGWRDWPQYTRLRAPGCYAYQIDGPTSTQHIIVQVTNASR